MQKYMYGIYIWNIPNIDMQKYMYGIYIWNIPNKYAKIYT